MIRKRTRKPQLEPTPIVTSKTIRADALLRFIKRIILKEPKRANLRWWVSAYESSTSKIVAASRLDAPECGTIGCIYGWGRIVLRPTNSRRWLRNRDSQAAHFDRVLGIRNSFLPLCHLTELDTSRYSSVPEQQTPEHAQFIAHRIDQFLALHPELKRRRIDV